MNMLTRHLLVLLMLVAPMSTAFTQVLAPQVSSEEAFKIEAAADFVLTYTRNLRLDLGIEKLNPETGELVRLDHSPNELELFFRNQRHKELVVVIFEKQAWREPTLSGAIASLNSYFFNLGFRRVVIQQARGYGRQTYSDQIRPPAQPSEPSAPSAVAP